MILAKVWRGAKIQSEVRKAINEEHLLNLVGVFSDKKAGDPVEYDQMKLILIVPEHNQAHGR